MILIIIPFVVLTLAEVILAWYLRLSGWKQLGEDRWVDADDGRILTLIEAGERITARQETKRRRAAEERDAHDGGALHKTEAEKPAIVRAEARAIYWILRSKQHQRALMRRRVAYVVVVSLWVLVSTLLLWGIGHIVLGPISLTGLNSEIQHSQALRVLAEWFQYGLLGTAALGAAVLAIAAIVWLPAIGVYFAYQRALSAPLAGLGLIGGLWSVVPMLAVVILSCLGIRYIWPVWGWVATFGVLATVATTAIAIVIAGYMRGLNRAVEHKKNN